MPERATRSTIGWDVGGAHLKAAAVDSRGKVLRVLQLPCPLWQGMHHLDNAVEAVLGRMPRAALHAVTMTGELVDLFASRSAGVRAICARVSRFTGGPDTVFYAGFEGFLAPRRAAAQAAAVASANWAASAQLATSRLRDALFIDIGSTTTDIVPIVDGVPVARGYADASRLACSELVYSGVVRTPVMAMATTIPFRGAMIPTMAEHFAVAADVYRLTGDLPPGADQLPAADNGAKTQRASARRLARMIGMDFTDAPLTEWQRCARALADAQLDRIGRACEAVASRAGLPAGAPVIGAGVGRFIARRYAARSRRRYREFASLFACAPGARAAASHCAPAVAVALLAWQRANSLPLIPDVGRKARR